MKHLIIRLIPTIMLCALVVAGIDVEKDAGSSLAKAESFLKKGDVKQARAVIDTIIDEDMLIYRALASGFYADAGESKRRKTVQLLIDQATHITVEKKLCKEEWIAYHIGSAMLYEELGRLTEAEVEYRKALALEPDSPELLNMLGWFYADEGIKLDEALKLTKKAVQLSPDNAMIIDTLGWAHYKLGDYRQAIAALRRAIELSPDEAELRYHLGAAYTKSGRKLQAVIELNKALILSPSMSEPQLLLKTLR